MSLKSEFEKIMTFVQSQTERRLSASYDSRARFVKNQTVDTHGLARKNAYRGYRSSEREPEATISLCPPIEVKYMQRKRNNSILIDKQLEVKYIDDDTLLLRVTCTQHPMVEGPGSSRWSYRDADASHSLSVATDGKTTVETFLISADSDLPIAINDNDGPDKLIIGAPGESVITDNGSASGRTVITDCQGHSVTCIKLQGANVNLWNDSTPEKVAHVINPTTLEYVSPTFVSEGFDDIFEEAKGHGSKPVIVKDLALWEVSDVTALNSNSGKLTATLNTKSVIIQCSIMKGSVLTFTVKGKTVSKDVPEGIYNILTHEEHDNLKSYREQVLISASEIAVDFAVTRLDYLTVLDVEKGTTNHDDSLEGRVDYGANMDIKKQKGNVNADRLLNRVSFVDLDED